ncbi:DUF6227 family protein [Streptomyces sp. TR06-5]|uniref:DUF6227 family protein n=1 Tax=Streptomyces sp. TR06-5 TaxID=3385976 RepID=UPI0039A1697F
MGVTPEVSPARHLQVLLARVHNPRAVPGRVRARLSDALLCEVEPQGTAPGAVRHGTNRHTFLLADGSVESLWERWQFDADHPAGGPRFEVRLREEEFRAPGGRHSGEHAPSAAVRRRPWSCRGSFDHARRLLRRAANPGRPGEETLRTLSGACGHAITQLPGLRGCPPARHPWCTLYEHAFLLSDGAEVCLYELEHDLTLDGGLVCEVYPDVAGAGRAVDRHARARSVEP